MKFNKINSNYKWKSRKCFCKNCNETTKHAYDNFSHKGQLTKIFICRTCEKTKITNNFKKKKFVVKEI